MKKVLFVSAGLAALSSASFAQFVNGGFETGDFTGWTVGLTTLGANAYQQVQSYDIDGPGPLGPSLNAHFSAGRATGVTTGDHGVTLTQSLALLAGTQYTFEFDWSAYRTIASTNSQGGIFILTVDGVEIARGAAGSTGNTTPKYGHVVGLFTPGANGSYSVGVSIVRPFTIPTPTAPTLFQAVDNFTMSPVVPEPATISLMAIGTAALLRRKRK